MASSNSAEENIEARNRPRLLTDCQKYARGRGPVLGEAEVDLAAEDEEEGQIAEMRDGR